MHLTYQIGHEAIGSNKAVDGKAMLRAMKTHPACTAEILIAGITEILETAPSPDGASRAIKALQAAAKHIDSR